MYEMLTHDTSEAATATGVMAELTASSSSTATGTAAVTVIVMSLVLVSLPFSLLLSPSLSHPPVRNQSQILLFCHLNTHPYPNPTSLHFVPPHPPTPFTTPPFSLSLPTHPPRLRPQQLPPLCPPTGRAPHQLSSVRRPRRLHRVRHDQGDALPLHAKSRTGTAVTTHSTLISNLLPLSPPPTLKHHKLT